MQVVVLEISGDGKATSDADPCSIRALMHELEEQQIVDTRLHGHVCERPQVDAPGDGLFSADWGFPYW